MKSSIRGRATLIVMIAGGDGMQNRVRGRLLLKQVMLAAVLLATHELAVAQSSNPAHTRVPTDEVRDRAMRIASSIMLNSQSVESLRELTDTFGGRLAGSSAYDRSAEWAAAKLRQYGITDVRLERFTIPNGWERGWGRGSIVGPIARHLTIESVGWGPSTPPGGVEARVVVATDLSPEAIERRAAEFNGNVVLVDWARIVATVSHKTAARQLRASYELFHAAGASAVLLPGVRFNHNVMEWVDVDSRGEVLPLPVAEVGRDDGELLRRLVERQPVRIAFAYHNRVSASAVTSNVIAEIPGETREWVLLGAHLDSWDYGTGAQDDGAGVVMILEAARAIAALGTRPKRSIRFALWGAEEPGLLGSRAYVQTHAAELADCVAALNTDHGAGRPRGWKVYRQDLLHSMVPISRLLLRDLDGDRLSDELDFDGDSRSFFSAGVPTLELMVDTTGYSEIVHKQGDTFDKVDPIFLKIDAAIVAVTAYAIAEHPQPIARHLSRQEVDEFLKKLK